MWLPLFLAICILGCDVLIFLLFQWTLGERRRTRRRRNCRTPLASGLETDLVQVSARPPERAGAVTRTKLIPHPLRGSKRQTLLLAKNVPPFPSKELSAYRRRAVAFASTKPDRKLAV
jgi:hypothetical protein